MLLMWVTDHRAIIPDVGYPIVILVVITGVT